MRKKLVILLTLLLLGAGCGNEKKVDFIPQPTEVLQPTITEAPQPMATEAPRPTATEVPLPTISGEVSALDKQREEIAKEKTLCGIAYLGYIEAEYAEAMAHFNACGITERYPYLKELTEQQTVLAAGGEWYLVVPASRTVTIKVNESVLDETDYEMKPGQEWYCGMDGQPVLLRCNVSDIYPNLLLTAETEQVKVAYNPCLSLKDGYLAKGVGVSDITSYDFFEYIESEGNYGDNENEEIYPLVSVSSAEQLLDAIAPDTMILIEPGYYNLSEYAELAWQQEGEAWNRRHPYVKLQECFDGVEIVVQNVDGLSIAGDVESVALTELVVEPRYAAVLSFENCTEINLSFLTMGHTEPGECAGNVLNFIACKTIGLHGMDLYGCGVYGIGAWDRTGDLSVYGSTIRDCTSGPFILLDIAGPVEFWNCSLYGSQGGGYCEESSEPRLAFYECSFGEMESNLWYFNENIFTKDCIWSEITVYPDYSGLDEILFEPDIMVPLEFTEFYMQNTCWSGYVIVDQASGESEYLPCIDSEDAIYRDVYLEFSDDGTGFIDYLGEIEQFTWYCDSASSVCMESEAGGYMYVTLYVSMNREGNMWIMLQRNEEVIWMY